VNAGDITATLLLIATLGVLLVAPICYLCISGYREDRTKRSRRTRETIELLEHKVWPGQTRAWYDHRACHDCGWMQIQRTPNGPYEWVRLPKVPVGPAAGETRRP
jgi:hypothetical protein